MTTAERVTQLRQLLKVSQDTRILDLLIYDILEQLAEELAAMRDGDQPRGFGSI